MKSILIASVISAAAALAAAALYFPADEPDTALPATPGSSSVDPGERIAERIALLESAVSEERTARQLLEDEVFYLTGELERLSGSGQQPGVSGEAAQSSRDKRDGSRREQMRRRNSIEGRVERLAAAGFLPGQADWIVKREQELQMQALQARFDAEKSGAPVDYLENRMLASDTLRSELGDADYERYLEANNRSTRVSVSSVIESSPAQTAGLQPGDEIVRYDGERVFSMTDLTRRTKVGEPGRAVAVDIMRDGNLMQVVMPRGPVGITGGRRRY